MKGFFGCNDDPCEKCGLYKGCLSPRMEPTGEGRKGILILAEGPGAKEDEQGIQLIGQAGQTLRKHLHRLDIDLDKDTIKSNSVRCRCPSNRTPKSKEIDACRGHVLELIKQYKPKLIIPLGGVAIESLLGHRWKKDLDGITKWRGWTIPDRDFHSWMCPTFHPSYINRQTTSPVAELVFRQDLEKAISMLSVPFPQFGNEKDKIVLLDEQKAIQTIRCILRTKPITSFDYETTGLKPHKRGHYIKYASISDGDNAWSFILTPSVKVALKRYLESEECKKIGANVSFEKTWSKVRIGCDVNGVIWDIVQAAHILDNRPGITGLKFQTYVRLGVIDYDSKIEKYLRSTEEKNANAFNQIEKADPKEIMLYNGLDSLFTYKIAMMQMEEMGYEIKTN